MEYDVLSLIEIKKMVIRDINQIDPSVQYELLPDGTLHPESDEIQKIFQKIDQLSTYIINADKNIVKTLQSDKIAALAEKIRRKSNE